MPNKDKQPEATKLSKIKSEPSPPAHERGVPKVVIDSPSTSLKSRTASDYGTSSPKMGEHRSSKHKSESSSKSSSSKSNSKSSSKVKSEKDDWSEVNEPDERRRIQNRLAQRKFREKAKDQKDSRDRELENQLRAGYSYSTPGPDDLRGDHDLSGLPWGGPSMKHIVERGQAKERDSQAGGSRDYGGSYYDYGSGSRGSESR